MKATYGELKYKTNRPTKSFFMHRNSLSNVLVSVIDRYARPITVANQSTGYRFFSYNQITPLVIGLIQVKSTVLTVNIFCDITDDGHRNKN